MKKKLLAIFVVIIVSITMIFTCVSCSTGIFELDDERDYHQIVATVNYKGMSKDIYKGQLYSYVASYGASYIQNYGMTVEEVIEYFYNSLSRNALYTLFAKSYLYDNASTFGIDSTKSIVDLNKDPENFLSLGEYVYAVDVANSDMQSSYDSIYKEIYSEKIKEEEEEEEEEEELDPRTTRTYESQSSDTYDKNSVASCISVIYGDKYRNIKYGEITADFVENQLNVSVEDFKASIVFDKIVDAKLKAETDNEIKTIIKSAKKQLLDNIASAYMSVDKFLDIQIDSVILNKYQEYITETDKAPEDSTIYNAAIEKMYKETKASSIKSYLKVSDYASALEKGTFTLVNPSNQYFGVKSILLKFSDEQTEALTAIKSMFASDSEKIKTIRNNMALGYDDEIVKMLLGDNKGIEVNVSNPLYNAEEDDKAAAYTDKGLNYLSVIYAMADNIAEVSNQIVEKYKASEEYINMEASRKATALKIVEYNAKVEAFTQWLYLVNDDSGMFSSDSYLVTPNHEDTSYVEEYTVLARKLSTVGLGATSIGTGGVSTNHNVSYDGTTSCLAVNGSNAIVRALECSTHTTTDELTSAVYTVVTEAGNEISFIINDYGIHIVMVTQQYGCDMFGTDCLSYVDKDGNDVDSFTEGGAYVYNKNYIYDQGTNIKYDYTYTEVAADATFDANQKYYVWKAGSYEKVEIDAFVSGVQYYTRVWELQNVTCDYQTYNEYFFEQAAGNVSTDNLSVAQIKLLFKEFDKDETNKYIIKNEKVYDKFVEELTK